MALKIDKGVPLPKSNRSGGFADVIATMKAGDSVRFDKKEEAERFRLSLAYYSKEAEFGCALRPEGKFFRVWRTERKSKAGGRGKKK